MTNISMTKRGALSVDQMNQQVSRFPSYRAHALAPGEKFSSEVKKLWGGRMTSLMANPATQGRFAKAALSCPPSACSGTLVIEAGGRSLAWRNPQAIENLFCIDGRVVVAYGPDLADTIELGSWDMVSIPHDVRHEVSNTSMSAARLVIMLSIAPDADYTATFGVEALDVIGEEACTALNVGFDTDKGTTITPESLAGRITRFESLVPYKKDLNRTGGLPPEATMRLSAGSVFPLIVPEGHIGRSRTAPMYGNQGLYVSIAECKAGDDGPPPHAHSDTQESFYVLDGSFDICTGLDNESVVRLNANDLIAVPNKVMRTFRNTSGKPVRLLVIIQGPDRMQDTVSFSSSIGQEFRERFGEDIIAKYAEVRMTFDAEERLVE